MLKKDEDYYLDKHGLVVFTEKYLMTRGYCCKSGCKHCPFADMVDKRAQRKYQKQS